MDYGSIPISTFSGDISRTIPLFSFYMESGRRQEMSLVETSRLFIEGKSSNTQHTYSSLSKNFSEYLESKNLDLQTLQPIHVKEFIYQQKAMNSKATYKRFLAALLRFVGRQDLLEYIKSSMKEVKSEEKFAVDITLEEVLKLIDVTDQVELKLAWSLMAFDGLRPGEVLGLFREDFDLRREKLILRRREDLKYGPKGMKPDSKPKAIPLNPLSMSLFKQLNEGTKQILPCSYKTLRKWFSRYVKEAGIHRSSYMVTMHKLRHFFGHYWTNQKGNIRILKEVMRHSKIEYTLLYTKPSEEEITEEFKQVVSWMVKQS
jgi:integrase